MFIWSMTKRTGRCKKSDKIKRINVNNFTSLRYYVNFILHSLPECAVCRFPLLFFQLFYLFIYQAIFCSSPSVHLSNFICLSLSNFFLFAFRSYVHNCQKLCPYPFALNPSILFHILLFMWQLFFSSPFYCDVRIIFIRFFCCCCLGRACGARIFMILQFVWLLIQLARCTMLRCVPMWLRNKPSYVIHEI